MSKRALQAVKKAAGAAAQGDEGTTHIESAVAGSKTAFQAVVVGDT